MMLGRRKSLPSDQREKTPEKVPFRLSVERKERKSTEVLLGTSGSNALTGFSIAPVVALEAMFTDARKIMDQNDNLFFWARTVRIGLSMHVLI